MSKRRNIGLPQRLNKTYFPMQEKINWKNHFLEFFFVTVGILIAFGLNSWNETRKEKELTQMYLDGLREELLDNKKELKKSLPYHQTLLKTLREDPLEARLSLNPSRISNSAWKLAENEIFKKYVDHDLYKMLSKLYDVHDKINYEAKVAGDRMSEVNVISPFYLLAAGDLNPTEDELIQLSKEVRRGWIPIFESWTFVEEIYLEMIDEILVKMEK